MGKTGRYLTSRKHEKKSRAIVQYYWDVLYTLIMSSKKLQEITSARASVKIACSLIIPKAPFNNMVKR